MSKEFICPNCGNKFRQHHQRGPNPPWCNTCTGKKYRKETQKEKNARLEAENQKLRERITDLEYELEKIEPNHLLISEREV